MLRQAGFSGVGTILQDREIADIRGQSIMVVGNDEGAGKQEGNRKVYIISSAATETLANALRTRLASQFGFDDCSIVELSDLTDKELINDICISLIDLEHPVLVDLTEEQYKSINHVLATSDGVLWLSGDFQEHPQQHLICWCCENCSVGEGSRRAKPRDIVCCRASTK